MAGAPPVGGGSGSRLGAQMGARAAWAKGDVWVLVPDDKPVLATSVPVLLERAFGGKVAPNPPDDARPLPAPRRIPRSPARTTPPIAVDEAVPRA